MRSHDTQLSVAAVLYEHAHAGKNASSMMHSYNCCLPAAFSPKLFNSASIVGLKGNFCLACIVLGTAQVAEPAHCSTVSILGTALVQCTVLTGHTLQTACYLVGTLSEAVDGVAEKAVLRGALALPPGMLNARRLVLQQTAVCRVLLPHLSMEALLLPTATILLPAPTLVPHSTATKPFQ